jgi:hypothetical protein
MIGVANTNFVPGDDFERAGEEGYRRTQEEGSMTMNEIGFFLMGAGVGWAIAHSIIQIISKRRPVTDADQDRLSGHVQALHVNPGDALVVQYQETLTDSMVDHIRKTIESVVAKEVRTLILDGNARLSVIHNASLGIPEPPPPPPPRLQKYGAV